jgi:galactosylgalactosylxylosylprotein 3-beta-glucuronosyltransferase 3
VIAITFLALAVVAFAAAGSPFADTGGDVPRSPRRAERLERVDDDVADREGTAAAFVLPSGVASQRSATRNDELEPISATTEAMTASSKTMSATSEAKAETPHEGEGSHLLVVITPTYARPTNKPPPQANALLRMLNAMCQSSRQNILWIMVIEFGDADPAPKLPRCVPGRHTSTVHAVTIEVPAEKEKAPRRRDAAANGNATESFETKTKKKKPPPHRGVAQRNAGLAFARDRDRVRAAVEIGGLFGNDRASANDALDDPLVYFGDDDNEYDPRVFDEIAKIKKVGVWPVGFPFAMAPTHVEAPALDDSGKVVGFYSKFCDKRRYNVDMAGFAMRVSAAKNATFSRRSKLGHLEDDFLRAALGDGVTSVFEPLADGATQVLVWHLGWKFDRDKGKWKLMYEVAQPPDPAFVCASAEKQARAAEEKKKTRAGADEERRGADESSGGGARGDGARVDAGTPPGHVNDTFLLR